MPEYLSRIYKNSSEDVLAKWQNIVQKDGIEIALKQVRSNPKILGELIGVGIGSFVGFSIKRINAIVNIEELPKRLKEYEESTITKKQAQQLLINCNYEGEEKELIATKMCLEQMLPNAREEKFIEVAGNVVDFKEFAQSGVWKEALLEYYNEREYGKEFYKRSERQ